MTIVHRIGAQMETIVEYPETPCERTSVCIKGASKILCGLLACPIICPLSCLIGTGYGAYQTVQCDGGGPCYRDEIIKRNTICLGCGILTSMHTTGLICIEGTNDIKMAVQQDMIR